MPRTTKPPSEARVAIFYEAGATWQEMSRPLPEGFVDGRLVIVSPGLTPRGWIVAAIGTEAVMVRVGTLGAAWMVYEPADRIQLWIPGDIVVPEGTRIEVELAVEGGPDGE